MISYEQKKNPAAGGDVAGVDNQNPDATSDSRSDRELQAAPRGYHELVALAKQLSRPLCSLIAQSDENDPFLSDRPGARASRAAWFAELWSRLDIKHGVHLRRVHYLLVSTPGITLPNGEAYENTVNAWHFLMRAVADARYQGLVDPSAFTDRKANTAFEYHPREGLGGQIVALGGQMLRDVPLQFSADCALHCEVDFSAGEEIGELGPFYLPWINVTAPDPGDHHAIEVWIEKSTMNDVLVPIAERRGVSLVVGSGEISVTQCHGMVRRVLAHRRPTRILYISDFDPAGQTMPVSVARKIEWFIQKSGEVLDVQLITLALTAEQVARYQLPKVPIKDSERRKADFEAKNGEGAVELDALEALHPGELERIVNTALDRFEDPTLERRLANAASFVWQQVGEIGNEVRGRYAGALTEIESAYSDLKANVKRHADAIAERRDVFRLAVVN